MVVVPKNAAVPSARLSRSWEECGRRRDGSDERMEASGMMGWMCPLSLVLSGGVFRC